jgi:type IV secretory pathway VirB2 component (pilin)
VIATRATRSSFLKAFALAALLAAPMASHAAFSLPVVTGLGCDILAWMKGELAIIVFLAVTVVTIVVGMFARMDWTKILGVVILYGILQGLATILLSSGAITLPSCFS